MIIEIIGIFTLFYLIPAVVGLFLCRKWNASGIEFWQKHNFFLFLIPLFNFIALIVVVLDITPYLLRKSNTYNSIKSYFDGN